MDKITYSFSDSKDLYLSYMPFVLGGGLFIPGTQPVTPGAHVMLSLTLFDESITYDIQTKVIWITPFAAQGNKLQGMGLQFIGEKARELADKIETSLVDMLKSNYPTYTM